MMLLSSYLCLMIIVSEYDSAFCQIVRAHLYLYFVAGKNLDVVHSHLARDVGNYLHPILQFNTEHCIGERLDDCPVLFYSGLFCHINIICLLNVLLLRMMIKCLPCLCVWLLYAQSGRLGVRQASLLSTCRA